MTVSFTFSPKSHTCTDHVTLLIMLPSLKTADFLKNDLFKAKLVEMSKMYPVIFSYAHAQ